MARTNLIRAALVVVCASCGGSRAPGAPQSGPAPVPIASAPPEASNEPGNEAELVPAPTAAPPALTRERLPRALARQKPRELVTGGLSALEKLLAATPEASVDRPTIQRRIAYDYFELYLLDRESNTESARQSLVKADETFESVPPSAFPPTAEMLYVMGLVREQRSSFPGAREAFAAATSASGGPPEVVARAHYGLALLAEMAGAKHEAARSYGQAREWLLKLGFATDEDRALRASIDERSRALQH